VLLGAARLDEHRRDPPREREVGERVAVQVPELAPPVAELAPAEAVLVRRDAFPGGDGLLDPCRNAHPARLSVAMSAA